MAQIGKVEWEVSRSVVKRYDRFQYYELDEADFLEYIQSNLDENAPQFANSTARNSMPLHEAILAAVAYSGESLSYFTEMYADRNPDECLISECDQLVEVSDNVIELVGNTWIQDEEIVNEQEVVEFYKQ